MASKKHYITDTEAGIRPINVIRKLPSCQLTDEEFVKEFFERFEAKALILAYFDKDSDLQCMGRLKRGETAFKFYRRLQAGLEIAFEHAAVKEIE